MRDNHEREVDALLRAIRAETWETGAMTGQTSLSERVLAAMQAVPRDAFVDPSLRQMAWADMPLPIGHHQTISQPFMVALMTDLIDPQPTDVVLEIGTGSGYQAAVLDRLVHEVHSVEVIEPLARTAIEHLQAQGCRHVQVHVGDGHAGWPAAAPYDAILVTAAAEVVPPALIEQLKPDGCLVIPVGPQWGRQELHLIRKTRTGLDDRTVLPVAFVPLTHHRGEPPHPDGHAG